MSWAAIRHFRREEWVQDPGRVSLELVADMDAVRERAGVGIVIHEACASSGHAADSKHYQGIAVDFHFAPGLSQAWQFRLLLDQGFGGIGWYPEWNHPGWHADRRAGKRVFWFRENGVYRYGLAGLLERLGLTMAEVEASRAEPSERPSTKLVISHAFTAGIEAELSDHPRDRGGLTRYGCTRRFLESMGQAGDVDGDGDVDLDDILALSPDDAQRLMRVAFWDAQRLEELPLGPACCHYDFSVNAGPASPTRLLQDACNFYPGEPLLVDGRLGPKTRGRVRELCVGEDQTRTFTARLIEGRRRYYRSLANPDFERGWLNRCDALEKYLRRVA